MLMMKTRSTEKTRYKINEFYRKQPFGGVINQDPRHARGDGKVTSILKTDLIPSSPAGAVSQPVRRLKTTCVDSCTSELTTCRATQPGSI